MKMEWKQPLLEELNVSLTMAGTGNTIEDLERNDTDESVYYDS